MEYNKNNLEQITKVDGFYDVIKALEENKPVIEISDRCINPNCLVDFLCPVQVIDNMYSKLETSLKNSKTHTLIGQYTCQSSKRLAEKFGKNYFGREQKERHSSEEESCCQINK